MPSPPREFLLRRLHSLTGIAPMGLFLFEHFFTNSYSHQGAASFNEKAEFLRSLPYVIWIEIFALGLPFGFHIVYGLKIMASGQSNIHHHPHPRNWMYVLQRVSAIPALGFIAFHVFTIRILQGGTDNLYGTMVDVFANPLIVTFYVVGVVSICFHFANGIATFCMTWGITVGANSQRIVSYAAAGVGAVLAGMAIWSVFGFTEAGLDGGAEAATETTEAAALLIRSVVAAIGQG